MKKRRLSPVSFRNIFSLDEKDDNIKTHWIIDRVLYPKHQHSQVIVSIVKRPCTANFWAKIGRLPTYWVAGRGSFDLRFEESWTWSMVRLSDKMVLILTPLSVIIPLGYDPPEWYADDDYGPAEWDIMFHLQSKLDVFVKRLSTSMCVGSVTNVAMKIVFS